MSTGYRHPDLSIDQQLAVTTAAANLQRQFDGVFGAETIERFLHSAYDEFAGCAVLCTHNADRSQMALGFFTHLAGERASAWSGGSDPTDRINPGAMAAMAERGIDIAGEYRKPWTDEVVRADIVVTVGCGGACPVFPGHRYLDDWPVADPDGVDLAAVRPIRDDIERRVRALLEEMDIPTHA